MKIHEKLTKWRELKGLSQAKLGAAVDADSSRVSRREQGEGRPFGDRVLRMARALGITADFLLDDALDEPTPGLSDDELRILWAAHTVGYDVAIRRIMAKPEAAPAPQS
jgi:transcriptional regulator with XRE-family HTH domain